MLCLTLYMICIVFAVGHGAGSSNVLKVSADNLNKYFDGLLLFFLFESFEVCATSCLRVTDCIGVNYDVIVKRCAYLRSGQQLSYGEYTAKDVVPMAMDDWKQVMKNDPCANKPCGPGQRCVPNMSSYVCEKFHGSCNVAYFNYCDDYGCIDVHASSNVGSSIADDVMLLSSSGWMPESGDTAPQLMINLTSVPFILTGVVTRGDESRQGWITKYTVEISIDPDCSTIHSTFDVTDGNFDPVLSVIARIDPPVMPTCVVISPTEYAFVRSMRIDLIGCVHPRVDSGP